MSYNLVNPTTGALTQVSGNIRQDIIPANASANNKLVAKSDIVIKYNYSMVGTASLEDDIKTFVTALIALGANTYAGYFNRSGTLGTAGNYSITVYAEEGTSTFASGYIALGAGAMGKIQYEVSYYKPASSSEEWTINKLVSEKPITLTPLNNSTIFYDKSRIIGGVVTICADIIIQSGSYLTKENAVANVSNLGTASIGYILPCLYRNTGSGAEEPSFVVIQTAGNLYPYYTKTEYNEIRINTSYSSRL